MENESNEKQELSNFKRPKRIVISKRDTIANDIKNGTVQGLIALIFSVLSVILFLVSIYVSYRLQGEADFGIGIVMFMTLVAAITSVILAFSGLKNKEKSRHYMERRALIIAFVAIACLTAVFIRGVILFASR